MKIDDFTAVVDGDTVTVTATADGKSYTVTCWLSHLQPLGGKGARRAYLAGLIKAAADRDTAKPALDLSGAPIILP